MARELKDVLRDATDLTAADRAKLAGLLLDSLDGEPDPGAGEAWAVEIRRRIEEVDRGAVELVPWEDVHKRLLARLNAR